MVSYRGTCDWLLRWAGHVARMGDMRNAHRVLMGNLMERGYLEDLGVNGRIILKSIFKKWNGAWNGLIWLRTGTGGGLP